MSLVATINSPMPFRIVVGGAAYRVTGEARWGDGDGSRECLVSPVSSSSRDPLLYVTVPFLLLILLLLLILP